MTPGRETELAELYLRATPRLTRLAYATLGSYAEAEDVVANCWLRLVAADRQERIQDVDAWSTVVIARAALDVARSARRRREVYPGPWLPEPIVEHTGAESDPLERVALDEHVDYALLVMLESLSPAERIAWVLHDLFGMPFDEIARTVGRTPAAVRQLASRARNRMKSQAPRVVVTPELHDRTVRHFRDAAAGGDLHGLLRVLDPDVVFTSDGGGKARAALRPIHGVDKVTRFLRGAWSRLPGGPETLAIVTVNGRTAIGTYEGGRLTSAMTFTFDGDRVTRIDMVRSPDKLTPTRHTSAARLVRYP